MTDIQVLKGEEGRGLPTKCFVELEKSIDTKIPEQGNL